MHREECKKSKTDLSNQKDQKNTAQLKPGKRPLAECVDTVEEYRTLVIAAVV